jgi:hypothetical protein
MLILRSAAACAFGNEVKRPILQDASMRGATDAGQLLSSSSDQAVKAIRAPSELAATAALPLPVDAEPRNSPLHSHPSLGALRLMVRDLGVIRRYCRPTTEEEALLNDAPLWERIDDLEKVLPADGGDGVSSVKLSRAETAHPGPAGGRLCLDWIELRQGTGLSLSALLQRQPAG